ncbi:MAG: hypothetical protein Q4A41_00595 [Bacillota bacterium]|nr:hypothetical protein [Bacillota bacterium]
MPDNTTNKKGIIKWVIALVMLMVIAKSAYDLKFFDLLVGICKLESDKSAKVKKVSLKTISFITRTGDEEYFIEEMASKGWVYTAKYGRGMIFTKDGFEILMTKLPYFGKYTFYEGHFDIG